MPDSLKIVEKFIRDEIYDAIDECTEAYRGESYLTDMNPPESVKKASARAATAVFMTYESKQRQKRANKACSGFAAGRVKNKGSVKAANR